MPTADEARSREELERLAHEMGLVNLTPDQLDQFGRAEAYMRGYRVQFPRDLALTDEPALVFRPAFHAGSEAQS